MARKRVPGYISKTHTNDFGLDIRVERVPYPKADMPASGDPTPEGQTALGASVPVSYNYRKVIPAGDIGSEENTDLERLTLPQYMDTVEHYQTETRDPKLHGPMAALRSAGKSEIPFNDYASFQPRCAPMPRTAGDEGFLESPAALSADPLMTDENYNQIFWKRDARVKDLYGSNRDGFLHNDNENVPSETDNAQLSIRRGQAAARMPNGPDKRDFIAQQGEVQKTSNTRLANNRMSRDAGVKGY